MKRLKREVIHAALSEVIEASDRCGIPKVDELEGATKDTPLNWDAFTSLKRRHI